MRLSSLVQIHPAWADVKRLDSVFAAAGVQQPAQAHSVTLPAVAVPPALAPPLPIKREGPEAETNRLTAIKVTAHKRINSLQNTLNQRTARIIQRRQKEVENQAIVDIQNQQMKLRDAAARRKTDRRAVSRVPIRDLGLQEIAFVSQLTSLSKYPGGGGAGPARQDVEAKLAGVRLRKKTLEDALAADLAAIDKQLAADLASAQVKIRRVAAAKMDELRKSEEERQAETTKRNLNEVDTILSTLAPLGSSPSATFKAVSPLPLRAPSPPVMALGAGGDAQSFAAAKKERANLAGQRDKMVQFITDDIKRRLVRLAAQQRWDIAFAPANGRSDLTEQAADLLRDEWKP